MTFPEDAIARPATPPNAIVGLILNLLLPGAGFTYIGLWGWHLRWIAIMAALTVLGLVVSAMLGIAVPVLLPILGVLAMLVHYGRVYTAQRQVDFQPRLQDGVKVGLIVGHVVLGVVLTGLLAAVLIPNLLSARERATRTWERSTARLVQTQVAVLQIDGTPVPGPCVLNDLPADTRAKIASCTVTVPAGTDPVIDLTFTSGRTLHLP